MKTMMSWFAMHGYGMYIWTSYALMVIVLTGNMIRAKKQRIRTQRLLRQWYKRVQ